MPGSVASNVTAAEMSPYVRKRKRRGRVEVAATTFNQYSRYTVYLGIVILWFVALLAYIGIWSFWPEAPKPVQLPPD